MKQRLAALTIAALLAASGIAMEAEDQELGAEAYGLLKASYSYDPGFPLDVRQSGTLEHDGTRYQRLVFRSFHDGLVPGILALPAEGTEPFPVVLLLHGLTADKLDWLGDDFTHGERISAGLLARGYAVLALDAQYHGQRAVYNDYVDPGEMVFQRGWGVRYANLMTQTIVDYRRAIDYLAGRGDIDTNRVGVLGYSMGGHMTFILGAVEPRIKAMVACVVPDTPGMPMRAAQFARDLGDDPLLMLMARQDQFYTVAQAQALFDRVPGDNKQLQFFDSGHSLPPEYTTQAVDWLANQL